MRTSSCRARGATVPSMSTRASLALLLVVCGWMAGPAAANGDPASDVLPTDDVYLPTDAPTPSTGKALRRAVERAYARHYRIKVAVIADPLDLGTVPSLFGKPSQYARFLGTELESLYVGPLLIVMPAGFGIYDGGRPVDAEEHVLDAIRIDAPGGEPLAQSAVRAVDRLVSSGALRSKDIRAPFVAALPLTIERGTKARLRFRVGDDSGWARLVARVLVKSHRVATVRSRLMRVRPTAPVSLLWKAARTLPERAVRVCVVAADAAGNRSSSTCSPVKVR
jgi:hypothetical protein